MYSTGTNGKAWKRLLTLFNSFYLKYIIYCAWSTERCTNRSLGSVAELSLIFPFRISHVIFGPKFLLKSSSRDDPDGKFTYGN